MRNFHGERLCRRIDLIGAPPFLERENAPAGAVRTPWQSEASTSGAISAPRGKPHAQQRVSQRDCTASLKIVRNLTRTGAEARTFERIVE